MDNPDGLPDLLKRWQPQPSPQPDFAAEVARRVEAETASTQGQVLSFRVLLPLAAAIAIMVGSVSGLNFSRLQHQSDMADAYARSIDPIKMTSMDHLH